MSARECAVWYPTDYGRGDDYMTFDTETEAARFAAGCEWSDDGEAYGVQYRDGTYLAIGEWPAYAEAVQEARRQAAVPHAPAVPVRSVKCPFTGREVPIYQGDDTPGWVGA